jgi:hypothetical protein
MMNDGYPLGGLGAFCLHTASRDGEKTPHTKTLPHLSLVNNYLEIKSEKNNLKMIYSFLAARDTSLEFRKLKYLKNPSQIKDIQ